MQEFLGLLLGCKLVTHDDEYVAVEVELDTPNSADQILEVDRCHSCSAEFVGRDDEVVGGEVDSF